MNLSIDNIPMALDRCVPWHLLQYLSTLLPAEVGSSVQRRVVRCMGGGRLDRTWTAVVFSPSHLASSCAVAPRIAWLMCAFAWQAVVWSRHGLRRGRPRALCRCRAVPTASSRGRQLAVVVPQLLSRTAQTLNERLAGEPWHGQAAWLDARGTRHLRGMAVCCTRCGASGGRGDSLEPSSIGGGWRRVAPALAPRRSCSATRCRRCRRAPAAGAARALPRGPLKGEALCDGGRPRLRWLRSTPRGPSGAARRGLHNASRCSCRP